MSTRKAPAQSQPDILKPLDNHQTGVGEIITALDEETDGDMAPLDNHQTGGGITTLDNHQTGGGITTLDNHQTGGDPR